ncbi:MAG: hypothetical protein Devi2KO_40120 [Devosia indica]
MWETLEEDRGKYQKKKKTDGKGKKRKRKNNKERRGGGDSQNIILKHFSRPHGELGVNRESVCVCVNGGLTKKETQKVAKKNKTNWNRSMHLVSGPYS